MFNYLKILIAIVISLLLSTALFRIIIQYFNLLQLSNNSTIYQIFDFDLETVMYNLLISLVIALFLFIVINTTLIILDFLINIDHRKWFKSLKYMALILITSSIIFTCVISLNGEQFSLLATLISSVAILKPLIDKVINNKE